MECEGNGKGLKIEVHCTERLNYHIPQFHKHLSGNGNSSVFDGSVSHCSCT